MLFKGKFTLKNPKQDLTVRPTDLEEQKPVYNTIRSKSRIPLGDNLTRNEDKQKWVSTFSVHTKHKT